MQCVGGPNDGQFVNVEQRVNSVLMPKPLSLDMTASYGQPFKEPGPSVIVTMSVYEVRAGSLHYVGPQ